MADWQDEESNDWLTRENRHVFILSSAGKPIFSLHGDEQKLSSFIGLVQAIVSFSEDAGDAVRTVKAGPYAFVFLMRNSIYLLSVSRRHYDVPHMMLELEYLHSQILFILTSKGLDVLKRNPNYDLRSLLGGTENVMAGLCRTATRDTTMLLEAVSQLKLAPASRAAAANILRSTALPDMLYGMLVAGSRLVTLVQPKNKAHACPPRDLLLLINFVNNLPSLRTSESWTPLCLPTFNASGFLYAYIVFVAPEVCMLLVTPKQTPEQFHLCQRAKATIVDKLASTGTLAAIETALKKAGEGLPGGDIPELVHYLCVRCCPRVADGFAATAFGFVSRSPAHLLRCAVLHVARLVCMLAAGTRQTACPRTSAWRRGCRRSTLRRGGARFCCSATRAHTRCCTRVRAAVAAAAGAVGGLPVGVAEAVGVAAPPRQRARGRSRRGTSQCMSWTRRLWWWRRCAKPRRREFCCCCCCCCCYALLSLLVTPARQAVTLFRVPYLHPVCSLAVRTACGRWARTTNSTRCLGRWWTAAWRRPAVRVSCGR